MIILIVPYDDQVKSLQNDIDYYVKNEEYEKAVIARNKLTDFIIQGKDAEIPIACSVIDIETVNK